MAARAHTRKPEHARTLMRRVSHHVITLNHVKKHFKNLATIVLLQRVTITSDRFSKKKDSEKLRDKTIEKYGEH